MLCTAPWVVVPWEGNSWSKVFRLLLVKVARLYFRRHNKLSTYYMHIIERPKCYLHIVRITWRTTWWISTWDTWDFSFMRKIVYQGDSRRRRSLWNCMHISLETYSTSHKLQGVQDRSQTCSDLLTISMQNLPSNTKYQKQAYATLGIKY